jgi:hypothetical protein
MGDELTPYEEISKKVTAKSLSDFAHSIFIDKSQRLTVELFANGMTDKEKEFKAEAKDNINKKSYELVELDNLLAKN